MRVRMMSAMICCGLLALVALPITAQETTGALRGIVSDPSGAVLPGVTVNLTNTDTGLDRVDVSDTRGEFEFPALPPGPYTLTATLDGFQTYRQELRVALGSSPKLAFEMALGAVSDVIEVTGEAPLVDVSSTTSGITVSTDELNAQVPIGREATQVVLLAPATTEGDSAFDSSYTPGQRLASIGGGSVAENSYQVNGLNITNFRNGLGSTMVPFEFVEELQVKTGGYEAEYGRSTGGVVNMVTKSGSNTLHGGFSLYVEPESLQDQEPDTYAAANQDETRESLEANASLGGAIVHDRLFFFGFLRYTNTEKLGLGTSSGTRFEVDSPYYGAKLDLNLSSAHRIEATYISDEADRDLTQYDFDYETRILGEEIGTGAEGRGGDNYILKYTGIFSENFLLSAQGGQNNFNRTDSSSNDDCHYAYNIIDGAAHYIGCWVNWNRGLAEDEREAYRLDGDLFLGDHSLRAGIDYEKNYSFDQSDYSGGLSYLYYTNGARFPDVAEDEIIFRERVLTRGGGFDTISEAVYLQDSWAVTPALTVNLGVRWEYYNNKNALGQSFIEIDDQFAPRLGLVWDVLGDGRSKAYASFGQYHLPIASNTNIRQAGSEFDEVRWYVAEECNPGSGIFWNADGSPCGFGDHIDTHQYADGEVPDPRESKSFNFKPMSQLEYIVGYEQTVGENWSLGVRGVYREFMEIIEDFTIDEGLYNELGYVVSHNEYRLGNPGSDFEGYFFNENTGELQYVVLSAEALDYPEASRKYGALELSFKRRFADNWMLQGSYTWSHLYGNYEGYVNSEIGQDDAGITQSFDFAALMEHSYGNLAQDRRHNLKVFGAYSFDMGLQLGANLSFRSGRPINSLGVHPTNSYAQDYGAFSFYTNGEPAPRGSFGTTDDILNLDTMLKYEFAVGEVDMSLRLDMFNLLGADGVTEVNEAGETSTGAPNPNWRRPTHYQSPRAVRLGYGLSF